MKLSYIGSKHVPILLICLFLWTFLRGYGKCNDAGKLINVVFRYDDYAANSATKAELKILETFQGYGFPITFGVIPFKVTGDVEDPSPRELIPLDSVKGEILKAGSEAGILEISMHGYSHQTNSADHLSEFANLAYHEQLRRLAAGRAYLEQLTGAPVKTFLPPWNTYDRHTISALEETGFSILSANKKGLAVEGPALQYMPISCELTELKDAVRAARRSSDDQPLIVALLHDYDFLDINEVTGVITFQEFFNLMDWVGVQDDVRVLSIGQAGGVIADLGARRAIRTRQIYYLEKLPPLSLGSSRLLYQESPSLAIVLLKMAAFYAVFIMIGIWLLRWLWKKIIRQAG
jgi:peptidoglycan/xylan/chitin deacetylase (PgdA/CDA1 family)